MTARLLLLISVLGLSNFAFADWPETKKLDGVQLVLNGTGYRKATFLKIKVYHAALYLVEKSNSFEAIKKQETPKLLSMKFLRDVDKKDIQEVWRDSFKEQCPKPCQFNSQFDQFFKTINEVHEGDLHEYVFYQDKVVVTYNSKKSDEGSKQRIHTILGADFPTLLLGAWLGPKPPNKSLKTGLLGLSDG